METAITVSEVLTLVNFSEGSTTELLLDDETTLKDLLSIR